MMHCFENGDGLVDGDDAHGYLPQLKSEGREALLEGKWFVKIDGSNGLLIFNDETKQYDLYRRYDDKKDKFKDVPPPGYINLPQGCNFDTYQSKSVSHRYYQNLQARPSADAKGGEAAIWREMYAQVDRAHVEGRLNGPDGTPRKYHSVELVGKNFSGTPGVAGIGIALHAEQETGKPAGTPQTDEEWYAFFSKYFKTVCCEGLVVEHKGLYWKVLAGQFGPDVLWKKSKGSANPPKMI
jgi:hypothetical protein